MGIEKILYLKVKLHNMTVAVKKQLSIYSPAYVNMELYEDGTGSFSLDDKVGWAWYGDDDDFVLGLIRVGDSTVARKFIDELNESDIDRSEIKEAIEKSLDKNPSDGLYHILGDNSTYLGFGVQDELIDEEYEIKRCLESSGVNEKLAEEIAEEIVGEALLEAPPTSDVFERLENRLTNNAYDLVGEKKRWKDVVKEAVDVCIEKEKTTGDFVECVLEKLLPLKQEGMELFFNEYGSKLREKLYEVANRKEIIDKISKKTGVDSDVITFCATNV